MARRDITWPLIIFALGALEVAALAHGMGTLDGRRLTPSETTAALALEAVACAVLCVRRRWPISVALAVSGLMAILPSIGVHMEEPVVPVVILGAAMYSAGRFSSASRSYLVPIAASLSPLVAKFIDRPGEVDVSDWLFILLLLGFPFGFGRLALRQEQSNIRERERETAQTLAEERLRIARELHDILAHSLSAMVMTANRAADVDPDSRSAQALVGIANSGRNALDDVGLMLRLLRGGDSAGNPQASVSDIPSLVAGFRRLGLEVQLEEAGVPTQGLTPSLELTVFRIVQEALTNSHKHAPGAAVWVRLEAATGGIAIEVANTASQNPKPANETQIGGGHGLVGMRERVEMFGGTVNAAPQPDGSFLVRAFVPMDRDT